MSGAKDCAREGGRGGHRRTTITKWVDVMGAGVIDSCPLEKRRAPVVTPEPFSEMVSAAPRRDVGAFYNPHPRLATSHNPIRTDHPLVRAQAIAACGDGLLTACEDATGRTNDTSHDRRFAATRGSAPQQALVGVKGRDQGAAPERRAYRKPGTQAGYRPTQRIVSPPLFYVVPLGIIHSDFSPQIREGQGVSGLRSRVIPQPENRLGPDMAEMYPFLILVWQGTQAIW